MRAVTSRRSVMTDFSSVTAVLADIGGTNTRVALASGTEIEDAPSGFRAIHRDAAMRLYVFGEYTYTLETIIQAGRQGIPIVSVPVEVNAPTRESRLIKSIPQYIRRSMVTMFRILVLYKPLKIFTLMALLTALPGVLAYIRFLILYFSGQGGGNVQSLVIGAALGIGRALEQTGAVEVLSRLFLSGADGLGLISYYDHTNGDLKVAHCEDVLCSSLF